MSELRKCGCGAIVGKEDECCEGARRVQTIGRLVNGECREDSHVWTVENWNDTPAKGQACDCGKAIWNGGNDSRKQAAQSPRSAPPTHRCGVNGFDSWKGDVCEACQQRQSAASSPPDSPEPLGFRDGDKVLLSDRDGVREVGQEELGSDLGASADTAAPTQQLYTKETLPREAIEELAEFADAHDDVGSATILRRLVATVEALLAERDGVVKDRRYPLIRPLSDAEIDDRRARLTAALREPSEEEIDSLTSAIDDANGYYELRADVKRWLTAFLRKRSERQDGAE